VLASLEARALTLRAWALVASFAFSATCEQTSRSFPFPLAQLSEPQPEGTRAVGPRS